MSVLGKKWLIKNEDSDKSSIEKILANKEPNIEEQLEYHDPFLFEDMEKAVARILQAIKNNERIIVIGDYDVDGISSAAILVQVFRILKANASYRLPNRVEDGYGLSEKFINEFVEKGISLIITVGCGISCHELIKTAKEKGIDTIITDHHSIPQQIPTEASAIIHPKLPNTKYPYPDLTGSGIAFKLAHALIKRTIPEAEQDELIDSFVDLASLGTVADLGPLIGENRLIVKKGLARLASTKWKGLNHLLKMANGDKAIDTTTIGYRIAPRINAAGRIGDPYIALSLLLQDDSSKIEELGNSLDELNGERQEMTKESAEEAAAHFEALEEIPYILIAENPNWHVGILGLVAGKLVEKYARPAIILQDFGDTLVASARSPEYFNVIEAITAAGEHLIGFGGHSAAAGFSIKKENLQKFKDAISAFAKEKLQHQDPRPSLKIDCELYKEDINFDFLEEIEELKPFGMGNERPLFVLRDVKAEFVGQVGKDRDHLKFSINTPEREIRAIAFHLGRFAQDIRNHENIDLVCRLDRNRWNNKDYLQLLVLDFKLKKG
ncbi:single-stranded-DNA-specific exonuclease RecJ [Candidatus Gracilibacteria bacterium]|nr:single-stranded-DNA-specific exonuclease RecJ [Candidatus Gracilibacteria bacterium]